MTDAERKAAGHGGKPRSKLGLALASIAVPVALFAGLEGLLRLAGLGEAGARGASRLPYQRLVQPVLRSGRQADGTEILIPADPRLPFQWVRRDKPADALRVIVFGGSATAGLGYSPNVTFARHLERLLRATRPKRTVEVLNLGITALSSNQVKELVREACAHYEPDVLVVYSGNNEFLELHARKYVGAHSGPAAKLREALRDTNLARLLQGSPDTRGATTADELRAGDSALRLSQSEIIEDIALTADEVDGVVERYGANLREMVDIARASSTPLILMTVASNWRWRGKDDLPADWKAELLGDAGGPGASEAKLLGILERKLDAPDDPLRYEWLYRRATLLEELGRHEEARDDYRAAMNADPHLRRALDAMNERALELRPDTGSPGLLVLNTVEVLARNAEHATIGFEHFYDYVHFTPRGAVLVGGEIARALNRHLDAQDTDEAVERYVADELEFLDALRQDTFDAEAWLGVGLDLTRLRDRDLWKYEQMIEELDEALELDPDNVRALVYRGNARSFRIDGADGALADWSRAYELELLPVVRANVERLERRRDVSR